MLKKTAHFQVSLKFENQKLYMYVYLNNSQQFDIKTFSSKFLYFFANCYPVEVI